jgi:hypothetical protein
MEFSNTEIVPLKRITTSETHDLPHKQEKRSSFNQGSKSRLRKKKCMAPLTLYSSNEKPTPERSRKCVASSYGAFVDRSAHHRITLQATWKFCNCRHCLERMRCKERRKESARASRNEVLLCERDGARAFCGAQVCLRRLDEMRWRA